MCSFTFLVKGNGDVFKPKTFIVYFSLLVRGGGGG